MNVLFEYRYRDWSNFKNCGDVVFSNPNDIAIDVIASMAEKALIDQIYFVADKVGVPDLHFDKYISSLDHDWHQVDAFLPTDALVDDPQHRTIEEFIESLRQALLSRP